MIAENNYDVFPRVLPVGVKKKVTVTPVGARAKFKDEKTYVISYFPREINAKSHHDEGGFSMTELCRCQPVNGNLSFEITLPDEQMWKVCIWGEGDEKPLPFYPSLYALNADLYGKMPLLGDFHGHSVGSDGRDTPEVLAANYRRAGFDFFALTDHHKHAPSVELAEALKKIPTDLKTFYGEEVHLRGTTHPHSQIHIVNFGGAHSVTDTYLGDEEAINAKIEADAVELAKTLPQGVNAVEYAYRKWIYETIHAYGGFCIFAHPAWLIGTHEYNCPLNMAETVLKTGIYDAFEVLGGLTVPENNIQVALYNDLRAEGYKIPIVGNSDEHGTEPPVYFNFSKTIVFAEDDSFGAITESIKNLYSLAVESMPNEDVRFHGPLRLVRYAIFLWRYYFPYHAELCVNEGRLIKRAFAGEDTAIEELKRIQGETHAYQKRFFGKD